MRKPSSRTTKTRKYKYSSDWRITKIDLTKSITIITAYFFALYFLDFYVLSSYLARHFSREVYSPGLAILMVTLAILEMVLILGVPFLCGWTRPDRWMRGGITSFFGCALGNLLAHNLVNLIRKRGLDFFLGFAYNPWSFSRIALVLFVLALFVVLGKLGSVCWREKAHKDHISRTRSYALG
jgi:hypothetical protein